MLSKLKQELEKLKNPEKARFLQRFFKTGRGEYGEGDIFWGIVVPKQRQVAKKYLCLSMPDLQELLNSKIHEHRLVALFILVDQYKKGDDKTKKQTVSFYLKNTKNINNWDLVDLSAQHIVGAHFFNRDKTALYKLARSKNLWERRIAMLATCFFIKKNRVRESLKIAGILVKDEHDLIHKAVGWMLREVGKRNQKAEEGFLKKHYKIMPRTMLRYAIEKFNEKKRNYYSQK